MGRNIHEAYNRAIAAATDIGQAPGRLLNAIATSFGLKADGYGILACNALWRRIGVVNAKIVIDGPWFEVDSVYQPTGSWNAWVMPVQMVPSFGGTDDSELLDLVAFGEDGVHLGKTWRMVGAIDHVGLELVAGQRVAWVFRNPKNWLLHWLDCCKENPNWLDAPETGPEAFGALVLEPRKIDWRTHRIEQAGTFAGVDEIRFADDPELRDLVTREMKLELPSQPRLRARKG